MLITSHCCAEQIDDSRRISRDFELCRVMLRRDEPARVHLYRDCQNEHQIILSLRDVLMSVDHVSEAIWCFIFC